MCEKCALGRLIIVAHNQAIANGTELLPNLPINVEVQHHNHHRIASEGQGGYVWQYHVNNGSVRVDCFTGGGEKGLTRYNQLVEAKLQNAEEHDFGNEILGNLTRSIAKMVAPAHMDVARRQETARRCVEVMGQVYRATHLP